MFSGVWGLSEFSMDFPYKVRSAWAVAPSGPLPAADPVPLRPGLGRAVRVPRAGLGCDQMSKPCTHATPLTSTARWPRPVPVAPEGPDLHCHPSSLVLPGSLTSLLLPCSPETLHGIEWIWLLGEGLPCHRRATPGATGHLNRIWSELTGRLGLHCP